MSDQYKFKMIPAAPIDVDGIVKKLEADHAKRDAVNFFFQAATIDAVRSCNKHADCDAARAKATIEGHNPWRICCRDPDCEDCFGK